MTPGVRLGIDVGSVRVGVAASDPGGILASPVVTLARDVRENSDVTRLAGLVAELEAIEVVIGLPHSMTGREGPAAVGARAYAHLVAAAIAPVPVRLIDERLTTVSAHRALGESGVRGRQRRAVIDQQAAVTLLQAALDGLRAGTDPGEMLEATT